MKILIIGLDGGDWQVLDPAIRAGFMPYLENLIKQGSRGVLLSTKPPLTPVAWASFQMGVGPGEHGIIDFAHWNRKKQKVELINSQSLDNTLWDKASKKGKKVGVINVPLTYPPKPINGCLISGFLTPSVDSGFTYPTGLKNELLTQVPDYEIMNLKEVKEYTLERTVRMIELRTKAAKFLLKKDRFDLFMLQFQAVDVVQHPLWPHLVKGGKKQKEIFQKFYSPLDRCMKEVSEGFEMILILSDHGFQTHKKRIMLGNLFYKQGLIDQKGRTKKRLNRLIKHLGFSYQFQDQSQIKIMGRSGWGMIYKNSKTPKLQNSKLQIPNLDSLKDPETGERVIKKVWRREELYSGKKLYLLPDFLVEPKNGYSITAAVEPEKGLFQEVKPGQDFHLGIHHERGIIACSQKTALPQKIEQVADWVLKKLE